jgi:hypothetical protein
MGIRLHISTVYAVIFRPCFYKEKYNTFSPVHECGGCRPPVVQELIIKILLEEIFIDSCTLFAQRDGKRQSYLTVELTKIGNI